MSNDWFLLKDTDALHTPSLLVYPERISHNIEEMLRIAGDSQRLRPHVKTYKMAEVIQMQREQGIEKFKCATLAEAELLATTGAKDILLAIQPVGPNINRLIELAIAFPEQDFSCLVDNHLTLEHLHNATRSKAKTLGVFIDINNGMNRTGISLNEDIISLYRAIENAPNLVAKGFHVYDGHLRIPNLDERKKACSDALKPVLELRSQLMAKGVKEVAVVVGGSPTFPAHDNRADLILSPGTVLLWDAGYGDKFTDMNFQYAAVLVTRLISKPQPNQFCLDLGHKSLASEMPFPRVKFLNTSDFEQVSQSEEHFVVSVKNPEKYQIGDIFYAVPMHICPTVAKYPEVSVVENGRVSKTWKVAARDHKISV